MAVAQRRARVYNYNHAVNSTRHIFLYFLLGGIKNVKRLQSLPPAPWRACVHRKEWHSMPFRAKQVSQPNSGAEPSRGGLALPLGGASPPVGAPTDARNAAAFSLPPSSATVRGVLSHLSRADTSAPSSTRHPLKRERASQSPSRVELEMAVLRRRHLERQTLQLSGGRRRGQRERSSDCHGEAKEEKRKQERGAVKQQRDRRRKRVQKGQPQRNRVAEGSKMERRLLIASSRVYVCTWRECARAHARASTREREHEREDKSKSKRAREGERERERASARTREAESEQASETDRQTNRRRVYGNRDTMKRSVCTQ